MYQRNNFLHSVKIFSVILTDIQLNPNSCIFKVYNITNLDESSSI